ncbi:TadE family protein [Terrabacter sp. BE26]|uniref:TadE family protein n=1 Tax=Terrabacter sp. BE26 TaxID=2898152 RepID=UPI0035BE2913
MAVEAAFVMPLILTLALGIVEYGLVFKDKLTMSAAVRAGARTASAEPRVGSFAADTAAAVAKGSTALNMADVTKMWVYKSDAQGYPLGGGSAFTTCTTCITFRWDAGAGKFTPVSDTWAALTQNACPGDPNHDTIGVYLEVDHKAVSNLFFKSMTLREHVVMTLEPVPVTSGCR